jgi:hypothetical protein
VPERAPARVPVRVPEQVQAQAPERVQGRVPGLVRVQERVLAQKPGRHHWAQEPGRHHRRHHWAQEPGRRHRRPRLPEQARVQAQEQARSAIVLKQGRTERPKRQLA